ncbi:MAG: Gfo/Idh/MocA family oxidoreductase [Candidatus Bathyarchaeia archaeon]
MEKRYKACLIGCGRMGATIDDEVRGRPDSVLYLPYSHAAAYKSLENVELVAVADVVAEKVEAAKQRYGVPRGYTDYKEMIEAEKPDIVSIATRPSTHASITIFAAEHGVRGIYCEKPLCCSMAEADAMMKACQSHGVKFNYGTQRRYMPLYKKIRELIEGGELGDIQCIVGLCGFGGVQWTHTHTTDMLMFLAGDAEVEYVQGNVAVDDADFDDNRIETDPRLLLGYVKFRNGVLGYIVPGLGYEFEVCGKRGKIRTLNNGLGCQLWKAGKWNILEETSFPKLKVESGTVNCIRDLIEAIETGRETKGNIFLARRSQEIAFGFVESHSKGGARISMPLENRSLRICPQDW